MHLELTALVLATAVIHAAAFSWSSAEPSAEAFGHQYTIHNPHDVEVHTVHLVQSAHLDIGCKTFGCSVKLLDGEPNLCQRGSVEPYAYHIVNRWFDEFLLKGMAYAEQMRGTQTPYKHMVQAWIMAAFFDCERASKGMLSWPGSGWRHSNTPTLHCANTSTLAAVRAAFQRGDLFFHAFPHNGEPGAFPDASLFEAALQMPKYLAAELNIPPPTTVSQRDVPGWDRATIPLLSKHGINGLSVGAGQPPGKPDTPPLFVWKDELSGTDVVVTYESSYGSASDGKRQKAVAFVLPSGVALAAGWYGDNGGPPPVATAQDDYAALRAAFPKATVASSSFDAFFDEANKPEVKALLPVVTAEIGDGWVYGVPADPLKNSLLREAARQRSGCIASGICSPESPAMQAFDRMLIKVPEHTAGVAMQIFLPDYQNWTNAQFDAARHAQAPTGFLNTTSAAQADYNTTINSWYEQRLFVTNAVQTVAVEHPELAASLVAAFEELQNVTSPSVVGLAPVVDPTSAVFVCGGNTVGFDARGALSTLESSDGTRWASASTPVGLYQYHTFDNEDYNLFMQDFASRVDGPGCGGYGPGSADDINCKNFRKPNVSSANPKRRQEVPALSKLWHRPEDFADVKRASSCEFVVEMTMDTETHLLAGAPEALTYTVQVSAAGVEWEVVQLNKQPTRLPEAGFFSFNPDVASQDPKGWRLQMLGSSGIVPTDVVGSGPGGSNINASTYGGSPHLRGVEAVTWSPPTGGAAAAPTGAGSEVGGREEERNLLPKFAITITSLDVPIVCTGLATPFPSPRTAAPDMTQGVHFNIFQNIWNTNYVMFYPFDPADANIRSRFKLAFNPVV